jgi:hypothetical protein
MHTFGGETSSKPSIWKTKSKGDGKDNIKMDLGI